jgi:hypothetical protein
LGQVSQKLQGEPTTLEETYIYLNQIFSDEEKYSFMTLPEEEATIRLHHGLGRWIRNNWGLWGNSKLRKYLLEKGLQHPDEMSSFILRSYHRYLNNNQFRVGEKILIDYFPANDTIFVSIYANYRKFFQTYASSVKAIAIVREHIDEKLLVEIIDIRNEPKKKPERRVGDIYEVDPIYCDLIPPKEWQFEKHKTSE